MTAYSSAETAEPLVLSFPHISLALEAEWAETKLDGAGLRNRENLGTATLWPNLTDLEEKGDGCINKDDMRLKHPI